MIRQRATVPARLRSIDYCDANVAICKKIWNRRPDTTNLRSLIYEQMGLRELYQTAVRLDRIKELR